MEKEDTLEDLSRALKTGPKIFSDRIEKNSNKVNFSVVYKSERRIPSGHDYLTLFRG